MIIELHQIKVKDLFNGYVNKQEQGVWAYGGMLNVRPPYQREFVYKPEQQQAVINTVLKGFPLNVMYWIKKSDGTFEVLDGQQRTMSICQYLNGVFSVVWRDSQLAFHNLKDDEQQKMLDYELMVYFCEGTDSEKIEWFKTINIAGEKLYEQEILNAVYSGPWVTEAKRHFSKSGCPAYGIGSNYLTGTPIRQDFFATALKWLADNKGKGVEEYMSQHQHDTNCDELWHYYNDVIDWVKYIFPTYNKLMKGLPWGIYFNKYHTNTYSPTVLQQQIDALLLDDEVTNKKGIYEYLLSGVEKHLNLRAFTEKQKQEAYAACKGVCAKCGNHFELSEMEADHIAPWSQGGKTSADNCQMLCRDCNRRKSDK